VRIAVTSHDWTASLSRHHQNTAERVNSLKDNQSRGAVKAMTQKLKQSHDDLEKSLKQSHVRKLSD
jgi:DNA-binding GntR family transcriptional regulator